VGVGERVSVDERWRITIPKRFRRGIRPKDTLIVERVGDILLLKKESREELAREFEEIRLEAEVGVDWNAEAGKHRYGGVKE